MQLFGGTGVPNCGSLEALIFRVQTMNAARPTALFLSLSLLSGCAFHRPTQETSAEVIRSFAHGPTDKPWTLGVSWLSGGIGGAAIRSAGFEHVIRRNLPVRQVHVASLSPVEITPLEDHPSGYAEDDVERAWRKFCRHQIDMTDGDQEIVRKTTIPVQLITNCQSGSVWK